MPLKQLRDRGDDGVPPDGRRALGTAVLLSRRAARRRRARRRRPHARGDAPARRRARRRCQSVSAILHGFSRSGNTISVGLFAGLSRRAAAEFSFLLSIPTILAAAAVENLHAYRHKTGPLVDGSSLPAYVVGMARGGRRRLLRDLRASPDRRLDALVPLHRLLRGARPRARRLRRAGLSGSVGELKVASVMATALKPRLLRRRSRGGATSFSESSSSPRGSFSSRRSSRTTRTTRRSSRP